MEISIRDVQIALLIRGQSAWKVELAISISGRSPRKDEDTIVGELLNSWAAVCNKHIVVRVHSDPVGAGKLAIACSGGTKVENEHTQTRKFLDTILITIRDEDITF